MSVSVIPVMHAYMYIKVLQWKHSILDTIRVGK